MTQTQERPQANVQVSVQVSRDLWRKAKIYAAERDLTVTAVMNVAIEHLLDPTLPEVARAGKG